MKSTTFIFGFLMLALPLIANAQTNNVPDLLQMRSALIKVVDQTLN
jgi:hypothetical protein